MYLERPASRQGFGVPEEPVICPEMGLDWWLRQGGIRQNRVRMRECSECITATKLKRGEERIGLAKPVTSNGGSLATLEYNGIGVSELPGTRAEARPGMSPEAFFFCPLVRPSCHMTEYQSNRTTQARTPSASVGREGCVLAIEQELTPSGERVNFSQKWDGSGGTREGCHGRMCIGRVGTCGGFGSRVA